jgi:hypothetical protein
MREKHVTEDMKTGEFRKLKARLLGLGGEEVFPPMLMVPVGVLLERGRPFEAKGMKKFRGVRHRCHHNAALHYARHRLSWGGTCEIVTGYFLIGDGWGPHSWLWDGSRVLESTVQGELYYGVVLNPAEAARFVLGCVMDILPGMQEFLRQLPAA